SALTADPARRSSLDASSRPMNACPTLPAAPVTRIRCTSVTTQIMDVGLNPFGGLLLIGYWGIGPVSPSAPPGRPRRPRSAGPLDPCPAAGRPGRPAPVRRPRWLGCGPPPAAGRLPAIHPTPAAVP